MIPTEAGWMKLADQNATRFINRYKIQGEDRQDFMQIARLTGWKAAAAWDGTGSWRSYVGTVIWVRLFDALASAGYGQEITRAEFRSGERRETLSLGKVVARYPDGNVAVTLGDTIADPSAEFAEHCDRAADIDRALRKIPARLAAIVSLIDLDDYGMVEVSEALGVTHSRISQLRTDAHRKLKPLLA